MTDPTLDSPSSSSKNVSQTLPIDIPVVGNSNEEKMNEQTSFLPTSGPSENSGCDSVLVLKNLAPHEEGRVESDGCSVSDSVPVVKKVAPDSTTTEVEVDGGNLETFSDAKKGSSSLLEMDDDLVLSGSDSVFVEDLTQEFYEKGPSLETVVVRFGPKDVFDLPDSINVVLGTKSVKIQFQTSNAAFLARNERDPDTKFVWHTELFGLIEPKQSTYKLQGKLELDLKKAEGHNQRWTRLSAKPLLPSQHKKLGRAPGRSETAADQGLTVETKENKPTAAAAPFRAEKCSADSSTEAFVASTSSSGIGVKKPTCFVSPYNDRGAVVRPGFTGLRNIGNTCFINSTIQVLANTKELKEYFLKSYHYLDINESNPLGMKGHLAVAFGYLLQELWDGFHSATEPTTIKALVGKKATQFANFAQHDAQEFLSFLLDGLHEDLNRVRQKPPTEPVEGNNRPDIEVAAEAWDRYLMRNDSLIVDLFHGQLKSRLECPHCSKISITFDPFAYLPVPFPENKRAIAFFFCPLDVNKIPVKMHVCLPESATVAEFFRQVSKKVGVPADSLILVEDFQHKIWQFMTNNSTRETIRSFMGTDVFYIFEILSERVAKEPVYNLAVIQRLACSKQIRENNCDNCEKESGKLRGCTNCFNAFYCGIKCQREDWDKRHKSQCRFPRKTELVGHPFLISIPKSKATFSNVTKLMEARARFTVDIFMPPVINTARESLTSNPSLDSSSNLLEHNQSVGSNGGEEPMDLEEDGTGQSSNDVLSSSGQSEDSVVTMIEARAGEESERGKMEQVEDRKETACERVRSKTEGLTLFAVRYCSSKDGDTDYGAQDLEGKRIKDKGDEVLDLLDIQDGRALAMDWINRKFSEDFVMVHTKDVLGHEEVTMDTLTERQSANLELQDLLQLFAEKEILSDQESWYCSQCKEHVEASKALLLWKLPSLLIIQLKRFIYSSHSGVYRSKNEKSVKYPIHGLDMRNYLCRGAPPQESVYDLYGVVSHSGSSYFGHYISHARLPEYDSTKTQIGWRNFNDSFVSEAQPSQAVDEDAYLLFYKRRGSSTRQIIDQYDQYRDQISVKKEAYQNQTEPATVNGPSTSTNWPGKQWDPTSLDNESEEDRGGVFELPECFP